MMPGLRIVILIDFVGKTKGALVSRQQESRWKSSQECFDTVAVVNLLTRRLPFSCVRKPIT